MVKIIGGSKPANILEERILVACMNQFVGTEADRAANGAKLASGLMLELKRLGVLVALDSDIRAFYQAFELTPPPADATPAEANEARQKQVAGYSNLFATSVSQALIGAGLIQISFVQPPAITNVAPKMNVQFQVGLYTPGLTQAVKEQESNHKRNIYDAS